VSASGGYLAVPQLSKKIRYKVLPILKFGQFVRADPSYGAKQGDILYFNKVASDLSLTASATSDELAEDAAIPEDSVAITQGSAQVKEYGRAVPYTGKLTTLGQIAIDDILETVLRNRLAKVLDAVHAVAFKAHDVCYIPTGAVAATWDLDGVPRTPATANLNAWHWREIVDYMRDVLRIPPYFEGTDEYACVATGKALRGVYDDDDFEKVQVYAEPGKRLTGEIGKYYHTRAVWTNHAGALSNAKGTGSVLGEAVFFGGDPAVHLVAQAPEIRIKQSTDYGRSMGLAWYGLFGSKATWEYAVDGEARVVWVTSS